MSKQSERLNAIKRLQTLRNIGPKMAEKLYALGVKTPEQMMKEDPEELFERLKIIDNNVDPCELYVFRGAILDLPWWECKNLTKRKKSKNRRR
ncbi:MAG: helix-hairpin-helix domain-containing protein [bacterium]